MLKFFTKQKNKIQKKLAIGRLLKQYENILLVEEIMEDWITIRVLGGQKGRRKELIEKQKRIKEISLFINYLKNL